MGNCASIVRNQLLVEEETSGAVGNEIIKNSSSAFDSNKSCPSLSLMIEPNRGSNDKNHKLLEEEEKPSAAGGNEIIKNRSSSPFASISNKVWANHHSNPKNHQLVKEEEETSAAVWNHIIKKLSAPDSNKLLIIDNGREIQTIMEKTPSGGNEIIKNRSSSPFASISNKVWANHHSDQKNHQLVKEEEETSAAVWNHIIKKLSAPDSNKLLIIDNGREIQTIMEKTPSVSGGNYVILDSSKLMGPDELVLATNHFDKVHKFGDGKIYDVYKGTLKTGQEVLVKRCRVEACHPSKLAVLSLLEHPNLPRLLGFCLEENKRYGNIAYEFETIGSLEDYLFDSQLGLDWKTRMKIALDVAQGLEYLHKNKPPVVHGDLHKSNILLDKNYNPKLFEHGLLKTHFKGMVRLTPGYTAPEFLDSGFRSTMFDIYAFGIVLFELISGHRAFNIVGSRKTRSIEFWAPLANDPVNYVQLADPSLKGQYSQEALRAVCQIAWKCTNETPELRPDVENVVAELKPWA